ncbi:hypothetical protein [Sphingomonas baiyangensis]|uniref:DUF3618 domain-containing protein n=1 Tax=Sphingomonas baiyangensis TaxID=2572576 RepID=A0A4V5PTG8_9SPHN|nr:hypothetical protein [Sphingomonas baiyangensis]TKD49948.1 hypothetical protein FBR43_03595 [Sphingomonas baiyangensis]
MSARLEAARLEAVSARAALLADVAAVKQRLAPARIMGDAVDTVRLRGAAIAADATDAVRARPAVAGGALSLALLMLLRRPIARWRRRRRDVQSEALPADVAPFDATPAAPASLHHDLPDTDGAYRPMEKTA